MNRFEQRLQKRLQNEEIAAGYREMAAELERVGVTDTDTILCQTKECEDHDKGVVDLRRPQTQV